MSKQVLIDHLFRHQYGKMVSILTRIFGLTHLETIEDAVQDTFIMALQKWRYEIPDNPEGWLTRAAKNRAIDLLRKIKADSNRLVNLNTGPSVMVLNDLFLEHEIQDSQLRMIFTACHPSLNPKDQIAFALKTIAGFSIKEISSALLLKEDTVKKRLTRARKAIKESNISFEFPEKSELQTRLDRVHEVIYLIFNEGFHSNKQEMPIRQDLCGEAIRLCKMILKKENLRTGTGYALFGLLCFHSSRLESRVSADNTIIDIKNQDRTKWYFPLIQIGSDAMNKSMDYDEISTYHLEAAIIVEHLKAKTFDATDWKKILGLYQRWYKTFPMPFIALNISIVMLQLNRNEEALKVLNQINPKTLEQKKYLYYGTKSSYFKNIGRLDKALECMELALQLANNSTEREYLERRKKQLSTI